MRKVIMKDPNKKQSPASIIGGILFLIAFIGSIIAMYIASQTDTYLCLVIVNSKKVLGSARRDYGAFSISSV